MRLSGERVEVNGNKGLVPSVLAFSRTKQSSASELQWCFV